MSTYHRFAFDMNTCTSWQELRNSHRKTTIIWLELVNEKLCDMHLSRSYVIVSLFFCSNTILWTGLPNHFRHVSKTFFFFCQISSRSWKTMLYNAISGLLTQYAIALAQAWTIPGFLVITSLRVASQCDQWSIQSGLMDLKNTHIVEYKPLWAHSDGTSHNRMPVQQAGTVVHSPFSGFSKTLNAKCIPHKYF